MKKLIIALVLALGFNGFAQETPPQQKKANIEKMTPEQRQQKHLAHLTKELNLDAKQQKAVGKILEEKSAKAHEFKAKKDIQKAKGDKMTPEEKTALKNKMLAEKADTEARMKTILSTDQYQKWLTLREENKGKMKENRGEMGKMTSEQHQQKHLAHLSKELNLDTKQQEAVGKILAEKSAKAQEFKAKTAAQKTKGDKMTPEKKTAFKNKIEAEKTDTEARMKTILTPEQYQKWLTIREENKGKMKEKRRGM
jgi:sarcosine oxidase delta subunit